MSGIGLLDRYQDAGTVTKANVKTSTGRVRGFIVTNANAAVRYFQLHNKATAPVATDVPDMWFLLPAGTAAAPSRVIIDESFLGTPGRQLSTGMGWSVSTTAATFTDSATAGDHTVTLIGS
jgi:hypothetical protein